MATTKLPVAADGPSPDEAAAGESLRETAIRAGVLSALGRPVGLYRVAVVRLWGDQYRVNVMTGADPTAIRTPHSFFVTADLAGAILDAIPPLRKVY